jgi:hypothetical protein
MKRFMKHTIPKKRAQTGQSLVEFVGVFPILFLAAVMGGSLIIGAHQAHIAAMAMNEVPINKMKMAQQDGSVDSGTLSGYINGGKFKASIKGSLIDSVSIYTLDPYTDLVVGTKQFTPALVSIPGFTITTGVVVNHNLLMSGGGAPAVAKSSSTPWVPGGTPVAPPWGP